MRRLLAALAMLGLLAGAANATIEARPDGDGAIVTGEACGATVTLSAGAPAPVGQPIATVQAEGRALGPCPGGELRRFSATVSAADLFRYGGLAVTTSGAAGSATLPGWRPQTGGRECPIHDLASLAACFDKAGSVDIFRFTADITCGTATACCPAGARGLMRLQGVRGKIIDGGGHRLRRSAGQALCPAIQVQAAQDVLIDGLTLDEDAATPPCSLAQKDCAATIRIQSARNVRIDSTRIYAGKAYVVFVWETDGFALARSTVADAGIIGVYVGHFQHGESRNVVIADSIIARARTNGLALQGAVSDDPARPVVVLGNSFTGNHWHGLWPTAKGGVTSGGQVLVADGRNIRVAGNLIADGRCGNCVPAQTVVAIELADEGPPPAGVNGLAIAYNILLNGAGTAIRQNPQGVVERLVLEGNIARGFDRLDDGTKAPRRASNRMEAPAEGLGPPIAYRGAAAPVPGADPAPLLRCRSGAERRGRCDIADPATDVLGYPAGR